MKLQHLRLLLETLRAALLTLGLALGTVTLSGCDEGPLEEAGEEVDDAIDDAGDELN